MKNGQTATLSDGLENVVANLGTSRDKASHSRYTQPLQDNEQLTAMYRGSAIARKIVDMPALDSMREWREWQADADQITKIEAEEKRLGLQSKMIKAKTRARLFGSGVIFIGTGEKDLSKPLNPARVGLGGIQYLTVLDHSKISPTELQDDPREEGYGLPMLYRMNTQSGHIDIHPSRLIILIGEPLPSEDQTFGSGELGDSSLLCMADDITNLDATMSNIASLVFEAKVDVLGVPNLMDRLRDGGTAYEDLLLRRATLAAMGKGINGMLIVDAEETYNQKSASFSTLPDIAKTFMQKVSAAANIPMTLLFGMSPGGLNSTGESDSRAYYDHIKTIQTLELETSMSVMDECLIMSALGNRPEEIFYDWRPLWQPTTKERAETGNIIAETFKKVYEMDVIPVEAVGRALVNGLTESGLAPGLEGDVADFYSIGEEDE